MHCKFISLHCPLINFYILPLQIYSNNRKKKKEKKKERSRKEYMHNSEHSQTLLRCLCILFPLCISFFLLSILKNIIIFLYCLILLLCYWRFFCFLYCLICYNIDLFFFLYIITEHTFDLQQRTKKQKWKVPFFFIAIWVTNKHNMMPKFEM